MKKDKITQKNSNKKRRKNEKRGNTKKKKIKPIKIKSKPTMKFTGERFIPNKPELTNLYQEHIIRYRFAS